ncbi:META domain-containing protein [Thalassococcus sp. BH17M4-6]|uniref:META domain-containing protein n=1 Tax=Thalassococcus sp. BH17M4-6 TaxID=3413148 RepID=UPI003BD812ED
MRFKFLACLAFVSACAQDETVFSYGAGERSFVLQSIDGAPVGARATLSFPAPGRISGQAPCNSFSGTQTVPYPWFNAGPLAVTRRACPDLAAEQAFLTALSEMTLVKVEEGTLRLSNDAGREMIFSQQPDG